MLFLISPAKSLDYDTLPHVATHSQPAFAADSTVLMGVLKTQSPQQISTLMSLSDTLAGLNVARYQAWSAQATAENVKNFKQAILAFNGDVYGGLDAKTLSAPQLDWAQSHVCILSGLYGVLRPLDAIQPHRLEMGTALATERGGNLYQFWGNDISDYLNERAATDTSPVIVNLASQEYFKAVNRQALKAPVVGCVFEDFKDTAAGGKYKIISVHAKRARGLMVRYAIENKLNRVEELEKFNAEGYRFDARTSAPDRLVFRRGSAR